MLQWRRAKYPAEVRRYKVSAAAVLAATGAAITDFDAVVISGSTTVTIDQKTVAGTNLIMRISGGQPNEQVTIAVSIDTDGTQHLVEHAVLRIAGG